MWLLNFSEQKWTAPLRGPASLPCFAWACVKPFPDPMAFSLANKNGQAQLDVVAFSLYIPFRDCEPLGKWTLVERIESSRQLGDAQRAWPTLMRCLLHLLFPGVHKAIFQRGAWPEAFKPKQWGLHNSRLRSTLMWKPYSLCIFSMHYCNLRYICVCGLYKTLLNVMWIRFLVSVSSKSCAEHS